MDSNLAMRSKIADLASDGSLTPAERVRQLREMRESVRDAELVGQIEGYIGSLELRREAEAIERSMSMVALRENANIRDYLISSGQATAEELDQIGYLSHAELDAREADGTLQEAIDLSIEEGRGVQKILRWAKGFEKGGEFRPTRGGSAGRRITKALDTGREKADRKASGAPKAKKAEAKEAPSTPAPENPTRRRDFSAELAEMRKQTAAFTAPRLGAVGRRLLAGSKDTQDLYSAPVPSSPGTSSVAPKRLYLSSRAKLHDKIAGETLAGFDHENNRLDENQGVASLLGPDHPIVGKLLSQGVSSLTPEERQTIRDAAEKARQEAGEDKPVALFMAGGMAAGKSSALQADPSLRPKNSVSIAADVNKELLPEYQEQKNAGEGAGAGTVHNESNDIAKKTTLEAMDLGLSMVVDGTGKNPDFLEVLEEMSNGYAVDVVGVTIPTDDAVIRAGRRAMETGRGASEADIRASHRTVTENFEKVVAAPFIRNVTLWDNGGEIGEPAVLIGRGENGNWSSVNDSLMDEFWAKADEPEFEGPSMDTGPSDEEKLAVAPTPEFKAGVEKKATDLAKTAAAVPSSPGVKEKEQIGDRWYRVLPDGSIDVEGDVELAAKLLGDGRKVRLNQPDEVSTLLNKLVEIVNEAKEKGEKAPNYNLCDVSVPGTNLFCVDSKGIPRVQMPQLAGFPIPGSKADKLADEGLIERSTQYIDPETGKGGLDLTPLFVANLRERGIQIDRDEVPASHLRATQDELNGANVAKIAKEMAEGRTPDGATLVSEDNYIVDGHHRWAAEVGNDAADGNIGDSMMMVDRVQMDILSLLAEAYAYAEEMGLPVVSVEDAGKAEGEKK